MALPGWDRWRNKEEEKERGRVEGEPEIICEEGQDRGQAGGGDVREEKKTVFAVELFLLLQLKEHHIHLNTVTKRFVFLTESFQHTLDFNEHGFKHSMKQQKKLGETNSREGHWAHNGIWSKVVTLTLQGVMRIVIYIIYCVYICACVCVHACKCVRVGMEVGRATDCNDNKYDY